MGFEKSFKIFAPFDIYKSVDEEGEVDYHGVASSTSIDRDGERMSNEVLHKAASQLVGQPVFFNHKHNELGVGKITKAWVEGEFLKISMRPTKAAAQQDVVMQIEEGILKAFSIGGKSLKTEVAVDTSGRDYKIIKDADFYEVSVVGIPANPDAQILGRMAKFWKSESEVDKEKREHPWATDAQARQIVSDHEKETDDEVEKRGKDMETEKSCSESAKKDEEKKEEKKEKDEVKKEVGPQTPNQPHEDELLTEAKALIAHVLGSVKTDAKAPHFSSHEAAPMPVAPQEKSVEALNMEKSLKEAQTEVALLKKQVEDYEIKTAKTKSLVVDEKFSEAPSTAAVADGKADFAKAYRKI